MHGSARRAEVPFGRARFMRVLAAPEDTQRRVLRAILAGNAGCEYGRRHGFGEIRSYERYRAQVPVCGYEDIRAALERMASGEPGVLTQAPVCAWEETGGSSAGAKLVPYTTQGLTEFRAGLEPWLESLHVLAPATASGKAYWSISPAGRPAKHTACGMPIGLSSEAAYFGDRLAQRLLARLAVPPAVGLIANMDAWRRASLLHLVACEDLALISVWSPTFLLELLRHLALDAEGVAAELRGERGSPAEGIGSVRKPSDASRAELLLDIVRAPRIDWRRLWPRLAVISCWNHARAAPYADELSAMFPGVTLQGKGLLATEALVTVPVDPHHDPVLALESGFFEFVGSDGQARMAMELDVGAEYELLLTTSSGLYRYAIGDRVLVTGRLRDTPTFRFVGRSGIRSDLCGEKLDEAFVAASLAAAGVGFGMLTARPAPAGYLLILDAAQVSLTQKDAIARRIDDALCANPQYAYARRLGQLAPVEALCVDDPVQRWLERGQARGQRLGDIKLPALHAGEDACSIFGAGA